MLKKIISHIKKIIKYSFCGIPATNVSVNIVLKSPNSNLQGRKILITGGSRGLGLAMAKKFKDEGADIVITGRDKAALSESADKFGLHYIVCDLRDEDSFTTVINQASKLLNGLDTLVNNAGISLHEWEIDKVTTDGYGKQFDTNLKAAYFLSQQFIKQVEQTGIKSANILFMSSERSQTADIIPYGLTKAAINSLVQGLAKRYTRTGIRVNAVAPGITATEMTGFNKDHNLFCAANTNKRVYLPEEVAEIACFLISDTAKCLSGQILVCNEAKTINSYF